MAHRLQQKYGTSSLPCFIHPSSMLMQTPKTRKAGSGVARFQWLLGHLGGWSRAITRWTLIPVWDSVARTWCSYLLLKLTGKEAKNGHWQLYSTWQFHIQQCCCGSGKLTTSHHLPGHSEIHRGLGPYGPGCSYATEGWRTRQFLWMYIRWYQVWRERSKYKGRR